MVWLYLALGGGVVVVAGRYLWARRASARAAAGAQKRMRDLVTEDVAHLGAELETLTRAHADPHFVQAQRAYESAQAALARSDEIQTVAEAVAEGNYEVACVRARRDGRQMPEERVPCFFDPRHGPSGVDVLWTQRGGGRRRVPACSEDAERVADGAEPLVRKVEYEGLQVPYWEAATGAYGRAYFAGDQHALAAFETVRIGDSRIGFGGTHFGTGPDGGFGVAGDPDPSEGGSHTSG